MSGTRGPTHSRRWELAKCRVCVGAREAKSFDADKRPHAPFALSDILKRMHDSICQRLSRMPNLRLQLRIRIACVQLQPTLTTGLPQNLRRPSRICPALHRASRRPDDSSSYAMDLWISHNSNLSNSSGTRRRRLWYFFTTNLTPLMGSHVV